jgi:hypothetical protein
MGRVSSPFPSKIRDFGSGQNCPNDSTSEPLIDSQLLCRAYQLRNDRV